MFVSKIWFHQISVTVSSILNRLQWNNCHPGTRSVLEVDWSKWKNSIINGLTVRAVKHGHWLCGDGRGPGAGAWSQYHECVEYVHSSESPTGPSSTPQCAWSWQTASMRTSSHLQDMVTHRLLSQTISWGYRICSTSQSFQGDPQCAHVLF